MSEYKVDQSDIERYVENYGANPYLIDCLVRYAEKRIHPGDALAGMLENDLRKFCSYSDTNTKADLDNLFKFVYNVLPGYCWGSKEKVADFLTGED